MADIDIGNDLEQVNTQLEQLVAQLNQVNTQREQLTQQIHNLNGIAMYLRGKQQEGGEHVDEIVNEYPPDEVEKDD